jgi:class 3 adenylate cyclase
MQVGIVSFCLFLAFLSNSALIKLSAFNSFYFYTFLSMGVLFGLAAALIIDFKSLDQSFGRSQLALPKVVRRLVAADVKKAVVEFSAITVLIDVVGYTKQLIQLNAKERDQYNSAIKSALQFLQAEFQGEKLSDTGDGAVYAWEYGNGEEFVVQLKNAIAACEKLIGEVSSQRQIQFRIGMAAGTVRCHFQAPDFSFLGDPINTAGA